MSSIVAQSTDGDGNDSMQDRYSVVHTIRVGDNDASQNTSVSMHNLSTNTGFSSDSGTCGTSFATEGSDVLEPDEFFGDDEYEDLDTLSLGSHPMVDGWVDSACSWMDHPMSLIQSIGFGKETSLLRQSKGRTRSTISNAISSVANMKISTVERRNRRLHRKGIHTNHGETIDIESTMGRLALENAKKKEIKIMRIQPKENFECRRIESETSEKEGPPSSPKTNEVGKELETTDAKKKGNNTSTITRDPTAMNSILPDESREGEGEEVTHDRINEELEEIDDSIADTKITEERAMENSCTQDEDDQPNISNTSKNIKIDPPIESKIVSIVDDQPIESFSSNVLRGSESSESVSITERPFQKEDKEDVQSLSNRDDHSIVNRDMVEESSVMDRDNSVKQGNESGITDLTHINTNSPSTNDDISRQFPDDNGQKIDDEKVLPSDIEIIDVLSMDDQDSWIPGSRDDQEHSIGEKEKKKYKGRRNKSKNVDHTSLYSVQNSTSNHKLDKALASNDDRSLAAVDDPWIEEGEKLNKTIAYNGKTYSRPESLSKAETTEVVRNEEKSKLQATPDDIFDDPKTREAFLGHRRGRLRDTGMDSNNKILRSQSRRKKLRDVLRAERGDSDGSRGSKRLSRSRSLGIRNPPSPEDGALIKQSRSKSREGRLVSKPIPSQKGPGHRNASSNPPSRVKDLVVVRSIAEGQRIRSSKRESIKYGTGSHQNDPISINKYVGEVSIRGSYDRDSSRSRHRRISDRRAKPSRQRSKSRDPTNADLAKTKESKNNILTNDERDDHESVTIRPSESRPVNSELVNNNRSDYDNAISATKELRKLEKKIEQQLRQAKLETKHEDAWDSQTVPSKEIRRMEKKLAKKLKAVTSDNLDSQTVSSKEIRKLERQLAQKLSGENENRTSRLKRIKRKVSKSTVVELKKAKPSSSAVSKAQYELHQVSSRQTERDVRVDEASPEFLTSTSPGKILPPPNQDNRNEKKKSENLKGVRSSLYLRRGTNNLGNRISRRIPEND